MDNLILTVSNLSAGYSGKPVFRPLSFDVKKQEIIALMGPSGSGKSTLLKVLAGLINPIEGSFIEYLEERATLMFQSPLLQPWLTVEDNVSLPALIKGHVVDVDSLLYSVGLPNYKKRYPFQLSGGEQRRVSLARALASMPSLMYLDEPFTGVDELTREKLFETLGEVVHDRGISCLLVTHNPYESVYLADKVILIGGSPAGITNILDISIPHPRTPSILESSECTHLVNKVRRSIIEGGT